MTNIESIVEAVKAAKDYVAIQSVLSKCTKDELHEVFLAVCGPDAKKMSDDIDKKRIASRYAMRIAWKLEDDAFNAMSFEEKYACLTDVSTSEGKRQLTVQRYLTEAEFQELAVRLGVDPNDEEVLSKVLAVLSEREDVAQIEVLASEGNIDNLKYRIQRAMYGAIKTLCEKHGVALVGDVEADSKALYQYYLKRIKGEAEKLGTRVEDIVDRWRSLTLSTLRLYEDIITALQDKGSLNKKELEVLRLLEATCFPHVMDIHQKHYPVVEAIA